MPFRKKSALLAALLALCLAGTAPAPAQAPQPDAAGTPDVARGTKGMVVAAEPFAAEAGIEILRQGGTAVDAAVAVAFALAVTHPSAGNLGGGGFMLIRKANGRATFVDYRETAPAAARPDMYLDDKGELIPGRSTEGWQAAGVPGTVAGLELALRVHGTMSLHQVLEPAIRLADKGFPVSERLARSLERNADRLGRDPESRKIFLRHARPYQPGEVLKQKDLARTLKRIAALGARDFYEGWLARRFVKESKKGGGLFTRDDLKDYRAVLRQPVRGSFRGYEILTAPPPSSGGVALLETLNMLEPLLADADRPDDPATIHLVTEALRRAFADRARYQADSDFVQVPVQALTDKAYAAEFRASIDRERASASTTLARPDPPRLPPPGPPPPPPPRAPPPGAPAQPPRGREHHALLRHRRRGQRRRQHLHPERQLRRRPHRRRPGRPAQQHHGRLHHQARRAQRALPPRAVGREQRGAGQAPPLFHDPDHRRPRCPALAGAGRARRAAHHLRRRRGHAQPPGLRRRPAPGRRSAALPSPVAAGCALRRRRPLLDRKSVV